MGDSRRRLVLGILILLAVPLAWGTGEGSERGAAPAPAPETQSRPSETQPSTGGLATPPLTCTGTVLRVDASSLTFEMITGTGLALKVLKLGCTPQTAIQIRGESVALPSLRRGDLVRVSGRASPDGTQALRIEVLTSSEAAP